jgi:hypothetical protein
MSEYTAYFDESYGNADAYSVAGYVAPDEQWKGLVADWRKLRKQESFSVLNKAELEHNAKGTRFEWPNLTDKAKAIKKKRINSKVCTIILNRLSAAFWCECTKERMGISGRKQQMGRYDGPQFLRGGSLGLSEYGGRLGRGKTGSWHGSLYI